MTPVGEPPGKYRAALAGLAAGRYRAVVSGELGTDVLEPAELEFEVGKKNLEFEQLALNEKLLKELAAATGGRYTRLELADRLVAELRAEQERRIERRQIHLAWPPLIWAILASMLCAEWYLRRKWRLR